MAWGSGSINTCDALFKRVESNDSRLVELVILPMKKFGAIEVERLADIITSGKNNMLKSISASGHSIPSDALAKLGASLASEGGREISYIAIGDENMKDEGVESFCSALEAANGGSLESIDFGFKNMTSVGAEAFGMAFGPSNIKRIELYRNRSIGDEGMIKMCSAACIKSEIPFKELEMLDISECDISVEGIQALTKCLIGGDGGNKRSSSIDLNASENPLGSEACTSLGKLISTNAVCKLSLKKCALGDGGILSLVESFKVGKCDVAMLDLSKNEISVKGALDLASSLAKQSSNISNLKEIILSDNQICDDGVLALANALQQSNCHGNETLKVVDLSSTKCGVAGAIAMLKCSSLTSVRLFNNNLGSDGFEALTPLLEGGHPSLEHLDLGGNRAKESAVASLLTAIMVKYEPDISVLRTIELGGNEVGDEVERILKQMEIIRPEIDVARDRPSVEQPNDFQGMQNALQE
eukprot:CAMPEP_0194096900 /NCGR_PEP_ID=MMETSP0149-20130528/57586_1 /TAXON_ID=122233 /ORGANISM="Chaetoceros debilis, Strain MM31A-1" /LENGTH=470 /DNA_ID=CAMNT_0038782901 /DNA_START=95 /DNA_END=1507 /DNA_ORIENTATION=-